MKKPKPGKATVKRVTLASLSGAVIGSAAGAAIEVIDQRNKSQPVKADKVRDAILAVGGLTALAGGVSSAGAEIASHLKISWR